MKTLFITLLVLTFSNVGWSKIDDLAEMIHQNKLEQKQIHQEMKQAQGWQIKDKSVGPKEVVLETTISNYSPKTKSSLLTYKKETADHRPSYKKQLGRVAAELNEAQGEN